MRAINEQSELIRGTPRSSEAIRGRNKTPSEAITENTLRMAVVRLEHGRMLQDERGVGVPSPQPVLRGAQLERLGGVHAVIVAPLAAVMSRVRHRRAREGAPREGRVRVVRFPIGARRSPCHLQPSRSARRARSLRGIGCGRQAVEGRAGEGRAVESRLWKGGLGKGGLWKAG